MAPSAAHYAEYGLVRGLEAIAANLSWRRRVALGAALGALWHRVDRRHRGTALENVARAYPEWPGDRIAALVRANFEHLGATAAEFLGLASVSREEVLAHCRFEGVDHFENARARRRGVLILSGHVGNWELAGAAGAARGYPLHVVGRRLKNPLVDRRTSLSREHFGGKAIGHRNAVEPILRALREGGAVAFLMDQRALSREAVRSRFFGQPVATNQGLAVLALRTGCPVVPAFDHRAGDHHVVRFHSPVAPPQEGNREDKIRRFTERFDAVIERTVRDCPEQWFWVHRRWRLPREFGS